MLKRKLTKGKKCKNCKDPFDQQRFGQTTCSVPCAIEYGRKNEEKNERKKKSKSVKESR